jgi:hypothetical protein
MKIKAGTVLPEAAALASLFTPAEVFDDEPVVVQEAKPVTADACFPVEYKVKRLKRTRVPQLAPKEVLEARYLEPRKQIVSYGTRSAVNQLLQIVNEDLSLEDAFYIDSVLDSVMEMVHSRIDEYA